MTAHNLNQQGLLKHVITGCLLDLAVRRAERPFAEPSATGQAI
jgi:hypothetical protein